MSGDIQADRAAINAGWKLDDVVYNSPTIESALSQGAIPLVCVKRLNSKGQLHNHYVLVTGEDYSSPTGTTLTPWCRFKINDPGSSIYDHLDSYERLNGQSIVGMRILYP
jgi:hypothetical protein